MSKFRGIGFFTEPSLYGPFEVIAPKLAEQGLASRGYQ